MALHLLKTNEQDVDVFTDAIHRMRHNTLFCSQCHNISDTEICNICRNPGRNRAQVCVVETIRDVIAIESTQQYSGLYHVLGGILSPLDGIGPEQLNISSLPSRILEQGIQEVIMALSPTIEGDTTVYYVAKQLKDYPVQITTIARGIAFGGELEYADETTLARSISKRLPVESYVSLNTKT